ncbi:hypothetical protein CW713_02730 [Methanophagales archaeon]|nr:MAG: hypothetical protein CW713_02730 [Methanophagales archaeon]
MRAQPAKYRGIATIIWRQVRFFDIYDSSPEGGLYHIIHQGKGEKLLPLTAIIHKGEVKKILVWQTGGS